jgi:hypothetical protein
MTSYGNDPGLSALPRWVPEAARHYLAHTETGLPIRVLARRADVHASTVLRQIRRFEQRRDDPLIDEALRQLSSCLGRSGDKMDGSEMTKMTNSSPAQPGPPSEDQIAREGARVLRRMAETGAVLAVARDMEMGVVVREDGNGETHRTAVVPREIAQAMALKEWIACPEPEARIARYHITGAGRSALKQLLADAENAAQGLGGFAEAQAGFAAKPGLRGAPVEEDDLLHQMRNGMSESPLVGLARRRDKDGRPFLDRSLVAAGERLREDFELSQMGPKVTQDWDTFLTTGGPRPALSGSAAETGANAARERVGLALTDLGPGLGDVALRACCYLEGMESLEKRMGWSARSGKIVLRIALQRLKRHYQETHGKFGPKIG